MKERKCMNVRDSFYAKVKKYIFQVYFFQIVKEFPLINLLAVQMFIHICILISRISHIIHNFLLNMDNSNRDMIRRKLCNFLFCNIYTRTHTLASLHTLRACNEVFIFNLVKILGSWSYFIAKKKKMSLFFIYNFLDKI